MPTFSQIEVTTSVTLDVEFEVFCACGAHMCNETDTRNSRNRNAPQAVVNACRKCIESETQPLKDRIYELEQLLIEAQERADYTHED